MDGHVKTLAALRIVYGALGIGAGLLVLLFFGGIAGLVAFVDQSGGARIAVPILGIIAGLGFGALLLCSLPGLAAGIGLLGYRSWARILTLVMSVIDLLNFPFGTLLGVYGLWVLLSPGTERLFERPAQPAYR